MRTHDRALALVGLLTACSAGACSLLVSTDGLTGVTPRSDAADAHSFCDDFDGVPSGANWMTFQDPMGAIARPTTAWSGCSTAS